MKAGPRTSKFIPVQTPKFNRKTRPFVDRTRVLLSSGRGGDGASIMESLPNLEFAGPAGGNGGAGGSVFLRCSNLYPDLHHVKKLGGSASAGAGSRGRDRGAYGSSGRHLILDVPPGTLLRDADTNQVVCDLSTPLSSASSYSARSGGGGGGGRKAGGETVMVLEGGLGGKGNAAFKSSICVSPVSATRGLPGNSLYALLELKMLADVALVGYPNAGKSSILGAISTSRPTVAPYPFTTLNPYVGKLYSFSSNGSSNNSDNSGSNNNGNFSSSSSNLLSGASRAGIGDQTCDIADLPGLVEGAYENRGLGHQFLQHVERSKLIALVVDMNESYLSPEREQLFYASLEKHLSAEQEEEGGQKKETVGEIIEKLQKSNEKKKKKKKSSPYQTPCEVVDSLMQELYFYDPSLPKRVACVLCNKMDIKNDHDGISLLQKFIELKNHVRNKIGPQVACFPVSANMAFSAGQQQDDSSYSTSSSSNNNNNNSRRASGLPEAVEFLTKRVFAMQRSERRKDQIIQNEQEQAMNDMYYNQRNRSLFNNNNNDEGTRGEENEGAEQEQELIVDDAERSRRLAKATRQRKEEALERLMSLKGRRISPGASSFGTTTTGSIIKKQQSTKNNTSSSLSSSSSSSLVDDQLGECGFASDLGPISSSWGSDTAKIASDFSIAEDPVSSYRVNNNNNNNNNNHNQHQVSSFAKNKNKKSKEEEEDSATLLNAEGKGKMKKMMKRRDSQILEQRVAILGDNNNL